MEDYPTTQEYLGLEKHETILSRVTDLIYMVAETTVDDDESVRHMYGLKEVAENSLNMELTRKGEPDDTRILQTLINMINAKLRIKTPEAAAEQPPPEAAAEQPPEAAQEVLPKSPQTYLKTHGYPNINDDKRVPGVVKRWADRQIAAVNVEHGALAPNGKERLVGMHRDALLTLREVAANTLKIEETEYGSDANQAALNLLIIDIDAKLALNLPPPIPLAPVEHVPELRTLEKVFKIKGIDSKKVIAEL